MLFGRGKNARNEIDTTARRNDGTRRLRKMILYSCLGALMFGSKLIMEFLPNIHPIAMFIVLFTIVFRAEALFPIYVFVFLTGIYGGFNLWWVPYLYIWTVLWALAMLIPKKLSPKIAVILYPLVCGVHGILFGILYAPMQAIMFGLSFKKMLLWIGAGIPYDVLHCFGNVTIGLIVYPLSLVLIKLKKKFNL